MATLILAALDVKRFDMRQIPQDERRGAWEETNAELPLGLLAISRERVVE